MALVFIVYVPTADLLGPDTTRMNKIEDLPDDLARMLVGDGSARWPTPDEVAEYEKTSADTKAGEPAAVVDLGSLKKAELLDLAERRGVTVDDRATKADIVAALEDAQQAAADAEVVAAQPRDPDGSLASFPQPGDGAARAVLHPETVAATDGEPAGDK